LRVLCDMDGVVVDITSSRLRMYNAVTIVSKLMISLHEVLKTISSQIVEKTFTNT
jgi:hypothetical protein